MKMFLCKNLRSWFNGLPTNGELGIADEGIACESRATCMETHRRADQWSAQVAGAANHENA